MMKEPLSDWRATRNETDLDVSVVAELAAARRVIPRCTDGPPAAWRDVRDGRRIKLAPVADGSSDTLAAVLARRRSTRTWTPPPLPAVATVLIRCLRVIEWDIGPDGYVISHRPVPSAGARHPIDIHLLAGEVDGLPSGSWRFDPLTCELVATDTAAERTLKALGDIVGQAPPPAALLAIAHIDRTLSRYPRGLSLLWRDAGALLATLHLCAIDVGLASCIVGATGLASYDVRAGEVNVGSLVVGSPPQADA
jgi:SagB-type dehydrogenase family enzyme